MRNGTILAVSAMLCALALGAGAAQMTDIAPDHWAYAAVEDLASKGLVLGYPDGNFLGGRTLTRYEMASIVKRVLDEMDQRNQQVADRLDTVEASTQSKPAAAPKTEVSRPAAPTASPGDVVEVNKLVEEFKVELTIIGADVGKLKEDFAAMQSDMETVKATVSDPEGALQTVISDVKKLNAIKFSGYIQARYEAGKDVDGNAYNGFQLRRARFKLSATKGNTVIVLNPNFGSSSYTNLATGFKVQSPDAEKDFYIQYNFKGDPAIGPSMYVGQMNWPFGYDVPYSSSLRECPERSMVSNRLFGGERDRGVKFASSTNSNPNWEIGVFNGPGVKSAEFNQRKDIVGNVHFALGRSLNLGVSGYSGKGSEKDPAAKTNKTRYGADLQWYLPETTLKAEYVRGKDSESSPSWKGNVSGWWAQIARNIGKSDELVARYDTLNPGPYNAASSTRKYGNRTAWDLGLIHHLDDATKVKFFYQINTEERNSVDNDNFRVEWVSVF